MLNVCALTPFLFLFLFPAIVGITNQRESAVAWSRATGKPLCRLIVWDDSRTKNTVAHFEHKLQSAGIELAPGTVKKGADKLSANSTGTMLASGGWFSTISVVYFLTYLKD